MQLNITPGCFYGLGSTGMDGILRYVLDCYSSRVGDISLSKRFMAVESVSSRPMWLPDGVEFVPMDVPLDQLYPTRYTDGIPVRLAEIPESCWKRTTSGCGANPGTAALGTHYIWKHVCSGRDAMHEQATDPDAILGEYYRLRRVHDVVMGDDLTMIYACSSAGSTGHAVLLPCIDKDIEETDAYVVILLAGPYCGSTGDGYVTQKRNSATLLESLYRRVKRHPDRIAVCYADDIQAKRTAVIQCLGEMAWDLLFDSEGIRLRREWRNWVPQNALEGRTIMFLNEFRRTIPEKTLQHAAATRILIEGMGL